MVSTFSNPYEVLNGIAHNLETGKTYMTGKYWGNMYEVNFVKK